MSTLKWLSLSGATVKRAASEFWRTILLLAVALTAVHCHVNCYLPESMRVTIELPKPGHDFAAEESGENFADEFERLTGCSQIWASTVSFCGQQAEVYSFAANGQSLPESENTIFVVLTNERYRVVIELAGSTSKRQKQGVIYSSLIQIFN